MRRFYPLIRNFKSIANLLKVPCLSNDTIFSFCWSCWSVLPLPSPVDVHIGKPIEINPDLKKSNYSDEDIDSEVENIKSTVSILLNQGLKTATSILAIKLQSPLVTARLSKQSNSINNWNIWRLSLKITKRLFKEKIQVKNCCVDNRSFLNYPNCGFHYKKIRYSRNEFERLFRAYKFDYVYHLGRMTHANPTPKSKLGSRLDLKCHGDEQILEQSLEHKVKKLVMLSTWHVYGAFPDNPIFIKENSLLKASIKNPDLRDVVEMDQLTTNFHLEKPRSN